MSNSEDALSQIALQYTVNMTSIRGRRIQRLLKREFSGAEIVLVAKLSTGGTGVMGFSSTGSALCVTDGRGRQVSISKWLYGATTALVFHFDLLKDSLPTVATETILFKDLQLETFIQVSDAEIPLKAQEYLTLALNTSASSDS